MWEGDAAHGQGKWKEQTFTRIALRIDIEFEVDSRDFFCRIGISNDDPAMVCFADAVRLDIHGHRDVRLDFGRKAGVCCDAGHPAAHDVEQSFPDVGEVAQGEGGEVQT